MQSKSSKASFDPLKPPQETAEPEMPQSDEFEKPIETPSFEARSAAAVGPLKPPQ